MAKSKRKTLPKIQKTLKSFLTDESGKMAKKDALGLSLGSTLAFGVSMSDAIAAHTNHSSGSSHSSTSCGHLNQAHGSWYAQGSHLSADPNVAFNISAVNGHYSGTNTAWHSSGYARGWHTSQAAVNSPRHCNTTSHSSSSHTNY